MPVVPLKRIIIGAVLFSLAAPVSSLKRAVTSGSGEVSCGEVSGGGDIIGAVLLSLAAPVSSVKRAVTFAAAVIFPSSSSR